MSNASSTETDHKRHCAEARAYAGAADLPTSLAERILMEAMGLRNRAMCLELLDVWQAREKRRRLREWGSALGPQASALVANVELVIKEGTQRKRFRQRIP